MKDKNVVGTVFKSRVGVYRAHVSLNVKPLGVRCATSNNNAHFFRSTPSLMVPRLVWEGRATGTIQTMLQASLVLLNFIVQLFPGADC